MKLDFTEVQKTKLELLKCQEMISNLLRSDLFYSNDYIDEQPEKIAVYSTTANTFDFLRPSLKSLYFNSDVDKVILITDTDDIPEDFPKELEVITLKEPPNFLIEDGPNLHSKYTYFCLLRVGLHRLFPQYNKILSLDYDTIIRKDICDLWNNNLGNRYYVGGVMETKRTKGTVYGYNPFDSFLAMSSVQFSRVNYVNAGVLLLNLKKLRDDGAGDEMIDFINEQEFLLPEQDIFNRVCHRSMLLLSNEYNSNRFSEELIDPKIIHYAGKEKKLDWPDVKPYAEMSWSRVKYRRETRYKKPLTIKEEKDEDKEIKPVKNDISLEELAKNTKEVEP